VLSTKDEVVRYVLRAFDTTLPLTIGEACDANRKYPRRGFATVATQMVSRGFLMGKGDGFVIRYSLTKKGQTALGQMKGLDPHGGESPRTTLLREEVLSERASYKE
jgi:hypothetical protein